MNFLKPHTTTTNRFFIHLRSQGTRLLTLSLFSVLFAIGTHTVVRAAVNITATKTATIIGDDGDGKADPGETIQYSVAVTNSGSTDATGVTFNDIIDLNTTLVNGSLNVSPLAGDNTFDTIGNTLLDVGVGAADPAVHVPGVSLFDNDTEFLGDTFTLKSVESTNFVSGSVTSPTESGGSVTVYGNGTFTYIPPVGFTGADHFDYIITDDGPDNILGNADDLTGAGRVTINVTSRVWYVKNNATAGGLGRSTDPFDTLVEAQTASAANDTIYVFNGDGTTTGQNSGISLKDGQRLLGEGVALTVPISVNGGATPTTLKAAGTKPMIGNSAGDGVSVSTTSASFSGVEIRGLNIGGTGAGSNAIDVTTSGAFNGSFELADNTIRAAGAEGIDVNGGSTGTLTASIHDNNVTATGNGIDVLRSSGAGALSIIAFDDNLVTGATGGIGINIAAAGAGTVLFDSNPATVSYDTVAGGTTVIGQSGNGVTGSGMVLTNVRGDISFADLDIYADSGSALSLTGTTPNFLASGTGTRLTANTSTPAMVNGAGAAVTVTDANLNLVLNTMTSTNSASSGVSLTRVSGTFTAPAGASISNATGTDFFIDGGSNANANVSVTYPGTITDSSGRLVQIQNVTATSTHTFSGAISDSSGPSTGISLTGNTGATMTFSGGLSLTTGSNAAFTATGGGTVSVTGASNTLTTTSGTALNVANTTIGASGLTFLSISVNGATKGIILNTTGSSGGLSVTGTGTTDGSGGTIQNISTRGAEFTSTNNLSLKNMNFTNANNSVDAGGAGVCDDLTTTSCNAAIYLNGVSTVTLDNLNITGTMVEEGINGNTVSNFTLSNSTISNCGNEVEEGCIKMRGLTGTSAISNSNISFPGADVVEIVNTSGNLLLNVDNSIFSDSQSSASGSTGIQLRNQGTASGIINVNNSLFLRIRTVGLHVTAINTGSADVDVTGNTFDPNTGTMIGIDLDADNTATLKFNIQANTKIYSRNGPAINIFGDTNAVINGRINNNSDVKVLSNAPASNVGSGIRVNMNKDATAKIEIKNNVVNVASDDAGIDLSGIGKTTANPGGATNTLDATVTGNNVTIGATSTYGLIILAATNAGDNNAVCANVASNAITRNPSSISSFRARVVNATGFFRMNGFVTNAEATWNANGNTPTSAGGSEVSYGGSGTFASCTAALPTNPTLTSSAMLPSKDMRAQDQENTPSNVLAQAIDSNSYLVSMSATISNKQVPEFTLRDAVENASSDLGSVKPLLSVIDPAPAMSGETVNVSIGSLPAGKSVTIQYRATVDNPLPQNATKIQNQGTVSGSNFSNVLTTNGSPVDCEVGTETCVPIDLVDLSVSKSNDVSGTVVLGNSFTWQIQVSNTATSRAAIFTNGQVVLEDHLPSGATYGSVNVTPSGGVTGSASCSITTNVLTCTTGASGLTIPGGEDFAAAFTVTPISGGSLVNPTGGVCKVDPNALFAEVSTANNSCSDTVTVTRPNTTINSINRQTPSGANTNASSVTWRVTFANTVSGVTASNFTLTDVSSSITGESISTVTAVGSAPATQWDVTVNTGTSDGTLRLDLANDTGMSYAVTNAPYTSGQTYAIDKTGPLVSSIVRQSPASNPTNSDVLVFRITFNEAVTSVGANSFVVNGTTTTITSVASVTPNLVFDFTLNGGVNGNLSNLNGTVGLDIASSPIIIDLAGNTLQVIEPTPAATNDQTYDVDNSSPMVTTVTSTSADGTYTTGAVISITVTFSENVTVTGTPQLTLETGTTDEVANYTSGSGTNTLTFTYTVQAGDASSDLDYANISALSLNGGTIKDVTANNATLTLPTPGASGSLGANKDIVIDTTPPTVTDVTSTASDGSYTTAVVIPVTITFSKPVTVTGTPQLTLETGATDRVVNYTSGSGTNTLTFNYTVQAGDTSSDLDYTNASSLSLNGGTIKDAATNNAVLTLPTPGATGSLGANKNIVIDTTTPTVTNVTSSKADGTYGTGVLIPIQITFSEPVNVTGTPQLTLETGTTDRIVSYASGSGTNTLTFNYTTQNGDTSSDLDYIGASALALNGGTIQDAAMNNAASTLPTPGNTGSLGFNKNIVIDATEPGVTNVTSTTANGSYTAGAVISITITFSENVTVTGTPQLTLETGSTDRAANYTSGSGTNTLTFNYTVQAGDTSADLDYINASALALNGGTIKDITSLDAVLTLPTPGAAGSLGANKDIVIDTTAPTITNVMSTSANGSYTTGAVIPVTVTFSENVTVTGTPLLTLETGTTDRVVNYAGGSGTNTLTFTYTVQAGDTSSDLDYANASALSLNGGTIKDTTTNSATLTLPTPGTSGSLGANKNIVIDTTAPDTIIDTQPANPTNSTSATFTFHGVDISGSGVASFECQLDSGGYSSCASGQNYTGLSEGNHTFDVRAIDNVSLTDSTPASYTWSVDTTAPTVTINQALGQADTTSLSPVNFTAVFSEAVTGFAGVDVSLGGTAGATTATVTGGPTTYNVAVSGMTTSGDITVSIPAGGAMDAATNFNTASTSSDNAVDYIYDATAPFVVSSVRADPSPTSAVHVNFTVTFSEPVTGVDATDFNLTMTGSLAGATVTGVSGSGSIYTVTVNTGSNNGTIRLDILDDDSIIDDVSNPLNGGFTSGEAYTIINKVPIFLDVPFSYWANSFIERLYNAGITSGCASNPLIYCPDNKVTRAEMAVFLLKTIHGPAFTPPPATGTIFADVPASHWAAAWIEQLQAENITAGCGNGNYCPDQVETTRAQMAIFLLRAKYGSNYVPPPATGMFNDVPTSYWAAPWIEQLARDGITAGCGNGNYCPGDSLTRAQMAIFLVRTLNVPKEGFDIYR